MPIEIDVDTSIVFQDGKIILDMTNDDFIAAYSKINKQIRAEKAREKRSAGRSVWNKTYYLKAQQKKEAARLASLSDYQTYDFSKTD